MKVLARVLLIFVLAVLAACAGIFAIGYLDAITPEEHIYEDWTITKEATCTQNGEKERTCVICGEVEIDVIDALGHDESEWQIIQDATCEQAGTKITKCLTCGETVNTKTIPAKNHTISEGDWIIGSEPTCTQEGSKYFACDACGKAIVTESIPALGHTEGGWIVDYEADCTENGAKHTECSVCGETVKTEALPSLGHNEGEWIIDAEATCTENGAKHTECTVCGETVKTEALPSLGHNEGVDEAIEPTCTETGLTEGKHCSVCDEILVAQTIVDALGHEMSAWSVVDPTASADDRKFRRTCNVCEEVEEISLGERFTDLTYVTFGDSITYGVDGVDWGMMEDPYPELVSNALGFKAFNNLAVSGATYCENTLNRNNMTKRILSFNGEADIISLMLGVNDFYVGLPLGTPESRDNTTIYGSLFLISEYLTENYNDAFIFYMTPFPAKKGYAANSEGYLLEDVADAIKYVAALYDIPVLDMYLYSEYENVGMHLGDGLHPSQSFMREYAAPKIVEFIKEYYGAEYKHQHTEAIDEAVAPTCTETGLTEGKHCSVCHEILVAQDTVAKLDHSYSSDVTAPTCTSVGFTTYTCDCGDSYVDNYVDMSEHSFGEWITVNEPTTSAEGLKERFCSACGERETEAIAKKTFSEGLSYQLSSDGQSYTLVGIGECTDSYLIIPATHDGLPVLSIRDRAFAENKVITDLYIMDGITEIGEYAFYDCRNLGSVRLPETLEVMKSHTFDSCRNLYDFPESFGKVTEIPDFAFRNCFEMLETVVIPYGIEKIGKYAFSTCDELKTVYIPDSVKEISTNAFRQDFGSTTIYYQGTERQWQSVKKESYWKTDEVYLEFTVIDLSTPSEGLEYILDGSTYSVKGIGDCTDTYVIIPNEYQGLPVTGVYTKAFADNNQIVAVVFNENIKRIYSDAFQNCTSLKHAYVLGDDIEFGTNNVFKTCTSFKFNEYDNGLYIGSLDNPYAVLIAPKSTDITSFNVHEDTEMISGYAFYGCKNLAEVNIPYGVKRLYNYTFYYTALENITLPDGLISISNTAFYYCQNIKYTEYGGCLYLGTSTNPYYALIEAKNTSITDVTIHSSTKIIADHAFYNCKSLTSVTIPDSVIALGEYAFGYCTSLTSVTIGKSIKNISSGAFSGCSALKTITIPSNVESIGSWAFHNCAMTSISLGDNVESIGDYAFYNSALTSVSFGSSITSIGSYAFSRCANLKTITIPANVQTLGSHAFDGCSGLTSANINCKIIGDYAFIDCTSLKTLTIGNNVTKIGSTAFGLCESLTSVTIPDSVTEVGSLVFWECSSLTTAKLGNGLTAISYGMFDWCVKLRSITIGSSVTLIDDDAFNNCTSLYTVQMGSSITHIEEYAFLNCSNLRSILIPESVIYIGKEAFVGCTRLTSVVFENTSGWSYSYYKNSYSGTSLSSASLENVSTAATYLRSTYSGYYWNRK